MKDSSKKLKDGVIQSRDERGIPDRGLASHAVKLGSWEHSAAWLYDTPAGELVLERYDWDYCGSDWVDFFVLVPADVEKLAADRELQDVSSLIEQLASQYQTLDAVLKMLEKQGICLQRSHTPYA